MKLFWFVFFLFVQTLQVPFFVQVSKWHPSVNAKLAIAVVVLAVSVSVYFCQRVQKPVFNSIVLLT